MSVFTQNGTWNATTNVCSDTGLAIPAVTAVPTGIPPIQDGNHYQYYVVSVAGGPYSYANMEAAQSYALLDVVVADPDSGEWLKNPANLPVEELGQATLADAQGHSVTSLRGQTNRVYLGTAPPTPAQIAADIFPPGQAWAYGNKPL